MSMDKEVYCRMRRMDKQIEKHKLELREWMNMDKEV